jgi:hypothetical protein
MRRLRSSFATLAFALLIGLPLGSAGAEAGSGAIAMTTLEVGDPYNGPTIAFATTPDVRVIPGTRISYIRNSDYAMFRSGGHWYYLYDGCWYQGANYKGPFKYVHATAVPPGVRTVSTQSRRSWTKATFTDASASKARVKSRHTRRTASHSK